MPSPTTARARRGRASVVLCAVMIRAVVTGVVTSRLTSVVARVVTIVVWMRSLSRGHSMRARDWVVRVFCG